MRYPSIDYCVLKEDVYKRQMKNAAVDVDMTMITTTIIMQMKYLQAGAKTVSYTHLQRTDGSPHRCRL